MDIEDVIIGIIADVEFPLITQPDIIHVYEDTEDNGFEVPLIVVAQIENSEAVKSTVTNETLTSLGVQIDIYSRGIVYDDIPYTPYESVRLLASEIQGVLNLPGLTRVTGVVVSYSPDVGRYTLRYNSMMDKDGYLYSR